MAFRRALAGIKRTALGAQHPSVGITMSHFGESLHALGEMEEAARIFGEALVLLRKAWPEGHLGLAILLRRSGLFLLNRGGSAAGGVSAARGSRHESASASQRGTRAGPKTPSPSVDC